MIYISEYTDMEPDMAAADLFPISTYNASEWQIDGFLQKRCNIIVEVLFRV